ncbi:terminase large subunit [Bacillus phage vB_BauM_KLEB27-3]|nr:terminase large subunit [Bacillus phage vB_BauM_KLEB27-3]
MSNITRYDQEMFEIFNDPAKWAAHHLGEAPRWYQEQILRHPHHRKVLRCGRRIGKCIVYDQRVMNPDTGEYVDVETLYHLSKEESQSGNNLLTLNDKYQLEPSVSFFVEDNGVKESFRVRTKYGAEVSLTGNHPVLTLDGWVEVDALEVGMRIATPKSISYFGNTEIDESRIQFIASLLAGGHYSKGKITFSCNTKKAMDTFRSAAEKMGYRSVRDLTKENTCILIVEQEDAILQDVLIDRRVPDEIFSLTKDQIALFLNVFYGVSGWAYNGTRPEIGVSSSSKQLMIDIKHLLLRFGIHANLKKKKSRYKDNISYVYQLVIFRKEGLLRFHNEISISGKEDVLANIKHRALQIEEAEHTVPKEVWKYIEEERLEKGLSKSQVSGSTKERLRTNVAPSLSKVAQYAENLESSFLYDIARSDLIWEEVVEIESLGMQQTYDVFVPETHNLVVEDVMVHNTWTMTAHMLWVAFTCNGGKELKKGATCLVATPYDTQAREIFDQLRNFIDNNEVLRSSVASITKSPYEIVFKNKSRIKLHTAGTRSGAEGGSLRGQKASWLYLDEVDYLGDKDFEAIYAITLEAPKRIGVMCASTPTGRRGKFFQICNEKMNQEVVVDKETNQFDEDTYDRNTARGWQEFYFPTMVNPEWSPDMEKELKSIYSEVAYEHEVLAEFGTEMVGVFNKDYLDEASNIPYKLLDKPYSSAPIAIGVDWDKAGAATQIVVSQWDPTDMCRLRDGIDDPNQPRFGRLKVINRIEIPKSEFTYDNAVKTLVELDKIYDPFAIYVDKGAGEYQIEVLTKQLGEKIRGVALGSAYDVRDPVRRIMDRKPLKPYLVNQLTLLLERGQLRIPSKDVDETFTRQMENYRVERIAYKTGEPTYSSDDEHALDGLTFTLFAFLEHFPDLLALTYEVEAARKVGVAKTKRFDPLTNVYAKDRMETRFETKPEWDEPGPPPLQRATVGSSRSKRSSWGRRGSSKASVPKRKSW